VPEITVVCATGPRQVLEVQHTIDSASTVTQVMHDLAHKLGWDLAAVQTVLDDGRFGVWGKPVAPDRILIPGDRLELYRPLMVDPKVARRARFVRQGAKTAGLFAKRRPGAKAGY
jgi:sulfur carrier protein